MTRSSLLRNLRDLYVLVICPPGEVADSLMLQLIRIGCHIQHCWPPPRALTVPVDLIFTGFLEDAQHTQVKELVAAGGAGMTVVALVDYESPTVLSQIIELGAHGVITKPLDANKVLPSLVIARRNSQAIAALAKTNHKLRSRLRQSALINRAKVLLMSREGQTEKQAHTFLSQEAMRQRRTMIDIAAEITQRLSP